MLYQKMALELKYKFSVQYDHDFDLIIKELRKIIKVHLYSNLPIFN